MFTNKRNKRERGQSMTEFAIMLPVLLIIMSGTLEVGNLLTTYNRVQLVAREGTRFGGGGGTDEGITRVVVSASQNTLEANFEDAYLIRPVINDEGTDWAEDTWVEQLIVDGGELPTTGSGLDPAAVFADYEHPEILAGQEMVIVVVNYEADAILGLPFVPGFEDRVPLQAYNVMPVQVGVVSSEPTSTCFFFPLGLNENDLALSLGWDGTGDINVFLNNSSNLSEGTEFSFVLGDEDRYWDFLICNIGDPEDNNYPSVGGNPAAHAMNTGCGAGNLYTNPHDPNDHELNIGDWVYGITDMNGVQQALLNHCGNTGGSNNACFADARGLRIALYDRAQPWIDDPRYDRFDHEYHISRVMMASLWEFDVNPSGDTDEMYITARFIRWDTACGDTYAP